MSGVIRITYFNVLLYCDVNCFNLHILHISLKVEKYANEEQANQWGDL